MFLQRGCRGVLGVLGELEDEDLAVRMERASGRGTCFSHGIPGKKVEDLSDQTGTAKRFFNVITLKVDVRINFVSDAVVSFIAFESDIVSRRANPKRFAIYCEARFPDA